MYKSALDSGPPDPLRARQTIPASDTTALSQTASLAFYWIPEFSLEAPFSSKGQKPSGRFFLAVSPAPQHLPPHRTRSSEHFRSACEDPDGGMEQARISVLVLCRFQSACHRWVLEQFELSTSVAGNSARQVRTNCLSPRPCGNIGCTTIEEQSPPLHGSDHI
jgi:hypothetical protein